MALAFHAARHFHNCFIYLLWFSAMFAWRWQVRNCFRKLLIFGKKFGVRILWVSAPCRLALAFQQFRWSSQDHPKWSFDFHWLPSALFGVRSCFCYEFIDFQMMFVDFRWCFAVFHWLPFISVYVVTTFVFILKNCNWFPKKFCLVLIWNRAKAWNREADASTESVDSRRAGTTAADT